MRSLLAAGILRGCPNFTGCEIATRSLRKEERRTSAPAMESASVVKISNQTPTKHMPRRKKAIKTIQKAATINSGLGSLVAAMKSKAKLEEKEPRR